MGRGREIRVPGYRIVCAVLAAWVLVAPPAALGETVPGQHDDGFERAKALWLADAEDEALPKLSALAQEGNAAAQLLIALIDKTPALQGPWLGQLPRDERVALMRSPWGLSGRSWMHAAAEQTPLGALWLRMWSADAPAALALEFAEAGEIRAAREALIHADKREAGGFAPLLDHYDFPPSLRFLAWKEGAEVAQDDLHPGDPQRRMLGLELDPEATADWLAEAPEALYARTFCETRCSATARACTVAAAQSMGAHTVLLSFGTPSESLIPAAEFAASARGQSALLRRAGLSTDARGRRHLLAEAEATDACYAAHLADEIERYRTPFLPTPVAPPQE